MLTIEQAKNLKRGDTLLDDTGHRWRVNGRVKTWKRSPNRVRVPLQYGLYVHWEVNEDNLFRFTLEAK